MSCYVYDHIRYSQWLTLKYDVSIHTALSVCEGFKCLIEIFHLFGLERVDKTDFYYNRIIKKSIERCLQFIKKNGDENSWVAFFKYKTCAFYSHYENQDLPPKPSGLEEKDKPYVIFGGYINQWRKLFQVRQKTTYGKFALSINMAKMGMPRANASMIAEAEKKMQVQLTTKPKSSKLCLCCGMSDDTYWHMYYCSECDTVGEFKLTKMSIQQQLRRTVREIFQYSHYTQDDHYEPFFPSTSANYNRGRKEMGAVSDLKEILDQYDFEPLISINPIPGKTRNKISEHYGEKGYREDVALSERFSNGQEYNQDVLEYDCYKLKCVWKNFMDKLEFLAGREEPIVTPVGLPEALKIRVISKGPPILYSLLKPLQKFLWREVKKNRVFYMISKPITENEVYERIGFPLPTDIIINGDYKASTDNLHSWVSETIVREICDVLRKNEEPGDFHLSKSFEELFVTSLIHHKFVDVDPNGKLILVDQEEGQLMGSVTSFPILCIANAALCRLALELSNKKVYRVREPIIKGEPTSIAPLLINGDDCTLKGDRSTLRQYWEKITAFGGLSTSVGKTLYSLPEKPIVVLNSTTYDWKNQSWRERKYINMGLMLCKKRSGTSKSDSFGYEQIGEIHHELYGTVPKKLWPMVSKRFIEINGHILKQCPNIPWNAPKYLGGPGLVPKDYSEMDLRISSFLIKNKDSKKRYQIKSYKVDPEWIIHEIVQKQLDSYQLDSTFRECRRKINTNTSTSYQDLIKKDKYEWTNCEDSFNRLYKYMTINTLFTHDDSDIFSHGGKFGSHRLDLINESIRRRNDASWANAREDMYLQPLKVRSVDEILHQKKDFFLPTIEVN
jgi:hypothetical protein